jgi:hypothetical protein
MTYHTKISLVKSVFRSIGFVLLLIDIKIAISVLLLSEVFGIVEEL